MGAKLGIHKHIAYFYCPGCKSIHGVQLEGNYKWDYDGNIYAPTLSPSILVTTGENKFICHSFVHSGEIEYLSDSHHALAGKTVPMVDWDSNKTSFGSDSNG